VREGGAIGGELAPTVRLPRAPSRRIVGSTRGATAYPPQIRREERFAMEKLLLRPQECAQALGLGRSKVYELIANGELPSITIGRSRRIPLDALREWVRAREVALDNRAAASSQADATGDSRHQGGTRVPA
jgi:excisionase family DNA binding protein